MNNETKQVKKPNSPKITQCGNKETKKKKLFQFSDQFQMRSPVVPHNRLQNFDSSVRYTRNMTRKLLGKSNFKHFNLAKIQVALILKIKREINTSITAK